MFVDLVISTHWCAWVLEAGMGTKGSEVWWTVVDMSNRGGNKTEDVGGGRKAPKEGLMGYQRLYFLL